MRSSTPVSPPKVPHLAAMIDISPLEDRVHCAIEQNPYIAPKTLRFETSEGRVTLRGRVGTFFQKQMAQEAIRRVAGVQEIANELEVCW
ncbi:MAG: BON domain-containing protein [Thermoguttaceae bacterium]